MGWEVSLHCLLSSSSSDRCARIYMAAGLEHPTPIYRYALGARGQAPAVVEDQPAPWKASRLGRGPHVDSRALQPYN